MDRLFKSASSVRERKIHVDDDPVDRLSRQYTVALTVFMAALVTLKQFVGRPINCWCPTEFTYSHCNYTNAVCWVSKKYYLDTDTVIPDGPLDQMLPTNQQICYYQWVAFVLIVQGVLTLVPCLVWRLATKNSGMGLSALMNVAHESAKGEALRHRDYAIRYLVVQISSYVTAQRDRGKGCRTRLTKFLSKACCFIGGRLYGNHLVTAYISVKLLYVLNAFGQLFLLDHLLVRDFHFYGFRAVEQMYRGQGWSNPESFPRVTLCEFEMRHQSRIHSYIVQCTLTINLFNEKLFLFVWFWFVFLGIVTLVSLFRWIFRVMYWPGDVEYVKRLFVLYYEDNELRRPKMLDKFVRSHLRRDGMFVVRLLDINCGMTVASEVMWGLWSKYNLEGFGTEMANSRAKQNGGLRTEMYEIQQCLE